MADDSSELDEIVQLPGWQTAAAAAAASSSGSGSSTSLTLAADPAAATQAKANHQNIAGVYSNMAAAAVANPSFDDSATNGFTTAPATSDDDFDSDDDDDSRSNSSNKNTSNSNSMISNSSSSRYSKYGGRHASNKGEQKRSHHNVLERKRRDLLKDSFAMLRNSVPLMQPKERVSRAEILKQAADYIQSTVKRNAGVREELDELIRRNKEFEEEQKRKKRGGVGGAGAGLVGNHLPTAAPATSDGADGDQQQLRNPVTGPNELAIKQEL